MADYKVPTTDLVIPAGTCIYISLSGLQNDPKYFPDPEKFDPYRFSDERKEEITPFTYMPFGEGPRICIGWYKYKNQFPLQNFPNFNFFNFFGRNALWAY